MAEPRTGLSPRHRGHPAHRPAACLPGRSWVWSVEILSTFLPMGQRDCSQRHLSALLWWHLRVWGSSPCSLRLEKDGGGSFPWQ